MKKILLFASGSGSNVEAIINYFESNNKVSVVGVYSNNPEAKVLEKAKKYSIPTYVFSKNEFLDGTVLEKIMALQPDLIVLAGFLWKIPETIIQFYPNKIINIHPALLPKYGGKGMYGIKVHQAVLENNESESGITIHFVNENYDEGAFIFQKQVTIEDCSTAVEIAAKVLKLEHTFFPITIENILNS